MAIETMAAADVQSRGRGMWRISSRWRRYLDLSAAHQWCDEVCGRLVKAMRHGEVHPQVTFHIAPCWRRA